MPVPYGIVLRLLALLDSSREGEQHLWGLLFVGVSFQNSAGGAPQVEGEVGIFDLDEKQPGNMCSTLSQSVPPALPLEFVPQKTRGEEERALTA